MEQRAWSPEERRALLDELDSRLDIAGLKELCYKLDIQYDNLRGSNKRERILELILSLQRQGRRGKLVEELDRLRSQYISKNTRGTQPAAEATPLCNRLGEGDWETLEQAVTKAVAAGGIAAMLYYRQPLTWPFDLREQGQASKNPSTIADVQATVAVLQTISTYLAPLTGRLRCGHSYLGEETREPFRSWISDQVSDEVRHHIVKEDEFFGGENTLRVIADGLDGTGSFASAIPVFCSAAAILIENQPRVSAIYDPVHHIVYSALLRGPPENPQAKVKAIAWQVATGIRTDLVQLANDAEQKSLQEETIGIHLSRTSTKERREFLSDCIPLSEAGEEIRVSKLERLAMASQAIYAVNCGILSMVDIARGALGGFVNQGTNLWDVAAGEVLVRACGGIVTDFEGEPIDYSRLHRTSLIAAKKHIYQDIKCAINW